MNENVKKKFLYYEIMKWNDGFEVELKAFFFSEIL